MLYKKQNLTVPIHLFILKRTGTPAASMEGQVPECVVKDRFNRLLETVGSVSHEVHARYTGQTMNV